MQKYSKKATATWTLFFAQGIVRKKGGYSVLLVLSVHQFTAPKQTGHSHEDSCRYVEVCKFAADKQTYLWVIIPQNQLVQCTVGQSVTWWLEGCVLTQCQAVTVWYSKCSGWTHSRRVPKFFSVPGPWSSSWNVFWPSHCIEHAALRASEKLVIEFSTWGSGKKPIWSPLASVP